MTQQNYLESGALMSDCGRYRYRLWRRWEGGEGIVSFIMLNPSTADGLEDDPTIKKCVGFARRWGFQGLEVANLYAWRATKPEEMRRADDPIGPDNNKALRKNLRRADLAVCAWGAKADICRAAWFCGLAHSMGVDLHALDTNADMSPRHPLFIAADSKPDPFDHLSPAGIAG